MIDKFVHSRLGGKAEHAVDALLQTPLHLLGHSHVEQVSTTADLLEIGSNIVLITSLTIIKDNY